MLGCINPVGVLSVDQRAEAADGVPSPGYDITMNGEGYRRHGVGHPTTPSGICLVLPRPRSRRLFHRAWPVPAPSTASRGSAIALLVLPLAEPSIQRHLICLGEGDRRQSSRSGDDELSACPEISLGQVGHRQ